MPYSRCAFSKTQTVLLTVDADANGVFSGKEAVILRLVTCPYLIRRQPSIMYLGKTKLYIVYILTHITYGSSFCTNTQSNNTNLWDGHCRPNWFQYGSSDYYQSCADIVKLYFGWFTSR